MVIFALLTWGLAFLLADAKIFGCSSRAYAELLVENETAEAHHILMQDGTLKLRNLFLKLRFFRDLLSCYFCLGVWCGPAAHLLLRWGLPDQQLIPHAGTATGWGLGLLMAAALGGACCYAVDLLFGALEKFQD